MGIKEMIKNKPPSVLSGTIIIAGGIVGAGMFSLPIVSAGMWLGWSVVALMIMWILSYLSGLVILETSLRFAPGSSFGSYVRAILGSRWAVANDIAIGFLLYILLYAYFSAGSSVFDITVPFSSVRFSESISSLLFGALVAFFVWMSTKMVSRLAGVLLGGMVLTFLYSNVVMIAHTEIEHLVQQMRGSANYLHYLLAALPFYLTSFGYQPMVPSLVKYYGIKSKQIEQCFFFGSLIAFVCYLLWVFSVFGLLTRADFVSIIDLGGNVGTLLDSVEKNSGDTRIGAALSLFANFAITTSFLGVALALFDFIADRLGISDTPGGRLKTLLATFGPPAAINFLVPGGFVYAIGYAGLVMTFTMFLVPVLMVLKTRESPRPSEYRAPRGSIPLVGISAVIIAVLHILAQFELLPVLH